MGIQVDVRGTSFLKSLKEGVGIVLSPSCASSDRSTATKTSVSNFAPVLEAPGSVEQRPASSIDRQQFPNLEIHQESTEILL